MKQILLSFLSILFLAGCAVGPLVSHETARTVGHTKHELVSGWGQPGVVLKWNYGISENWDFGVHIETLSVGIRTKYAFINNHSHGWSLATALGVGSSVGGSHSYADLILSYFVDSWEPYGALRIVDVKSDKKKFTDQDTGQITFEIDSAQFQYGQGILGTRYWVNPHWLFSLEFSTLFGITSGFKADQQLIGSAGFGYRF